MLLTPAMYRPMSMREGPLVHFPSSAHPTDSGEQSKEELMGREVKIQSSSEEWREILKSVCVPSSTRISQLHAVLVMICIFQR